jgi:two-component system cell cycle response regulator
MAAMNIAYPLADALLLGLVVSMLALTGWHLDRAWLCIVAGTATLALSDSAFLYEAVTGASAVASVIDAGWPLAMLLLAAAAWQPARRRGTVRLEGARVLAVPAVFGLTSLGILVYGQFELLNLPAVALAATSLLTVIARMAFTFREKLHLLAATEIEARTDALTGVGNRRKLMTDLGTLLDAQTPAVLMLLDLDGFKAYNDTFGHPAGDALLARLAKKLAVAIEGEGEVYRIGGDEFCVLAPVQAARREAFAATAQHALQEQGEGFRITAAAGTVSLPEEAADVAEALRLVDTRMYDEKDGRRASAGRQSRDVLLRALYERDERLQGHLGEIVELARSVGVALALPPDEVADLALAAELHEVGKLAIPDSILRKAAPLTDEEERFLRRHPLIGERILSSAPALAKVSRVVRAIHERADGEGYPDGLRGSEIPLAARIIGTCIAFVGLTNDAPNQRRRSVDEALAELRRAAGAEFDPAVVDALFTVHDAADVPLAAAAA